MPATDAPTIWSAPMHKMATKARITEYSTSVWPCSSADGGNLKVVRHQSDSFGWAPLEFARDSGGSRRRGRIRNSIRGTVA